MTQISQTFTSSGETAASLIFGEYSLFVGGNAASTVKWQRSRDSGATYETIEQYAGDGSTDGGTGNPQKMGKEPLPGVLYRFSVAISGGDTVKVLAADRL